MARQSQLVCQHLENISYDALSKYQDVIRGYVSGRQGIYALYRKNELYYVRLASNLRNGLKHHLRDRHRQLTKFTSNLQRQAYQSAGTQKWTNPLQK